MSKIYKALLPLCIASSMVNAETTSYQSIANELALDADGTVKVKVLLVEDDDEISCADAAHDFSFNISSIVAQKWYDTLLLSRNANSLVDFVYENSNCALTAIKLPKLYEHGSNVNDPSKQLKETGKFANVALIGTNILSAENYSSSGHYGRDVAAAAFDGYVYSTKFNSEAGDKINRGIWISKTTDVEGNDVNPWLQVDFNKTVTITGLRILTNEQSLELGRSPRNAILYVSADGEEFEKAEDLSFAYSASSEFNLSSAVSARFFRLVILDNFGDRNFIEVDELEFYQ